MKSKLYQVDAFSDRVFGGNPAAVVPLEAWLEAAHMQAIAAENNLAETAFFVRSGPGAYDLRWFTPNSEVDLCGHATLASAGVIFRFLDPSLNEVRFQTRSGELKVERGDADGHVMSLPAAASQPAGRFCSASGQGVACESGERISFFGQRRRRRRRAHRSVEFTGGDQSLEAHGRSGNHPTGGESRLIASHGPK